MSESREGSERATNPHDWKAAKKASPERFVAYPVGITHELAGYVNEHLNRVMVREIKSGVRPIERKDDDMDDPFERAHKVFSVGYHSNFEKFGTLLSEYQIMGISGIIREYSRTADMGPDEVIEAGRKIMELKARFEAALPKNSRKNEGRNTLSPSLGAVVKRWGDKLSKSKGVPYD